MLNRMTVPVIDTKPLNSLFYLSAILKFDQFVFCTVKKYTLNESISFGLLFGLLLSHLIFLLSFQTNKFYRSALETVYY